MFLLEEEEEGIGVASDVQVEGEVPATPDSLKGRQGEVARRRSISWVAPWSTFDETPVPQRFPNIS